MAKKYVLFLSTNGSWGGSEVLWTRAMSLLLQSNLVVRAGAIYPFEVLKDWLPQSSDFIDLSSRIAGIPFAKRVVGKITGKRFSPKDKLHESFKQNKPDLVIISQGNNTEGKMLMQDCVTFNIPFLTLTHLVTQTSWPGLDDESINLLRRLYKLSKANFFVSSATLDAHTQLLGEPPPHASVVYNPFTKKEEALFYPSASNGIYKIALIGRLETFHKGYDLLIEVMKMQKWKQRPVHFSIYGKGPHRELLERLIALNGITNITLYQHNENVEEIWKTHQLLLMPSRIEGQSLTLIEAMRFKRAAIATAVGGTTELIDDGINGFVVRYPEVSELDIALERAWSQRDNWEQMGIEAWKTILQRHPADALTFFCDRITGLLDNY